MSIISDDNSRCLLIVEVKHSAKSLAALNDGIVCSTHGTSSDQRVIQPLVIVLLVVVRHVFTNCTTQRRLPKENHSPQAFILYRADESLRIRIQIGRHRRQPNDLRPALFHKPPELLCILCPDQRSGSASKQAPHFPRHKVSVHLQHPHFIWLRRNACNMHGTICDAEQHVVCHQPPRRPHLHTEEVARSQDLPMGLQERRPSRALAAFRRRLNAVSPQHIGYGPASYLVAQISQRPLNSGVAPTSILLGHTHDQRRDLTHDDRTTGTTPPAEVPFLCNLESMPSHQGVWGYKSAKFQQDFMPYRLCFPRK